MELLLINFITCLVVYLTISFVGGKIKYHLNERQYSKFKKQFGDIIEFTYQKQDGTKTTFYKDADSFTERKE